MFQKVHIEISNICNLQCSFCPEVTRAKGLISLDLFERLIAQVAPITEQVCFHLMGDPLVHPRLAELVNICDRFRARLFFVTNGMLMDRPEKRSLLLHPAFRQVCFSLHSFNDNFPGRDPSAYLERIFQYSEQALRERPDLYINYRLWNLTSVRGSQKANLDLLRRIAERFATTVPTDADVRVRKSYRLTGRLYLHFDTEFVWPDPAAPSLGTQGTCYGLSSHFGILIDGTVVPCCLDKEGAIALGNASEQPLLEILQSPRARAILRGFERGELVETLCQRCTYIDRFAKRARRLSADPTK